MAEPAAQPAKAFPVSWDQFHRDCRALAEFYRQLLGLRYREGEEPPTDGTPDEADWLVLLDGQRSVILS